MMKAQRKPSRTTSRTNLHADSAASGLLSHLTSRTQAMVDTLKAMVELESPSFSKAHVDRLGEMLAHEFQARGGQVRFHREKRFGNHLQINFRGKQGSPVLLLGHFDTVWEAGTLKTMPCRQSNGRLFGPGVFDMKGGIVQMLFALEAMAATGGALPRPITVLLVSDEEVGSESSRHITEALARKAAAVFVLEPAAGEQGALKTARKGVGDYTIKVTGVPSHAGLDFRKGHSAILELARQLLKIEQFTDLKRGVTVSPGIIQGGVRTNVVAAEARCEVDIRVERIQDARKLDQKFRSLKPYDRHCQIEVTGELNRPPMERSSEIVNLFRLSQKLAGELGFSLQETSVGGGSDGNFTAGLGIPTLDGLGAVGEGAHAKNESIVISELAPRAALLARLIQAA